MEDSSIVRRSNLPKDEHREGGQRLGRAETDLQVSVPPFSDRSPCHPGRRGDVMHAEPWEDVISNAHGVAALEKQMSRGFLGLLAKRA